MPKPSDPQPEQPDARKVIQEAIRTARILGYGDVKILARAAEALLALDRKDGMVSLTRTLSKVAGIKVEGETAASGAEGGSKDGPKGDRG